jgi:hypothetical protein
MMARNPSYRSRSDVNAEDVTTTPTLLDVRHVDILPEFAFEMCPEVVVRMSVVAMCDQIDVVSRDRVFDSIDCLFEEQLAVLGVMGFLEIRRPGVVVDRFRYWTDVVVG